MLFHNNSHASQHPHCNVFLAWLILQSHRPPSSSTSYLYTATSPPITTLHHPLLPRIKTLPIPYPVLGPRLLYTHTLNTTCNSNLSTHARTHQPNRSRTRLLNQIPSPPHFYIITPSSYLTSLFHLEKAPTPLHRPLHTHIKHVNCIC